MRPDQIQCRWIPSHQDLQCAADVFEEWCITWNARVDRLAFITNGQRSTEFWQAHAKVNEVWNHWAMVIRTLRQFYLNVAAETGNAKTKDSPLLAMIDMQDDDHAFASSFVDQMPINWRLQLTDDTRQFPVTFMIEMIESFHTWEEAQGPLLHYTDIEICIALIEMEDFHFPL